MSAQEGERGLWKDIPRLRVAEWKDLPPGRRAVLRGRVVAWDPNSGRFVLRDESGDVPFSAPRKAEAVETFRVGDLVAVLAAKKEKEFPAVAERVQVLVPCRVEMKELLDRNPPWLAPWKDRRAFERLRFRSDLLQLIRRFFLEQGFTELDVPALQRSTGMEPHLEPFFTRLRFPDGPEEEPIPPASPGRTNVPRRHGGRGERLILHTSPELALKKMLVAGFERIFFLGHVFRNGELAPQHQPEFTMLEWYRAYADYRQLMRDTEELVGYLWNSLKPTWGHLLRRDSLLEQPWQRFSVRALFLEKVDVDLVRVSPEDFSVLLNAARRLGYREVSAGWTAEEVFFLLFLNEIEPVLGSSAPAVVQDYPAWLSSLARKKPEEPQFVERFEVYIDRVELANAFSELNDPEEQLARFRADQRKRRRLGKSPLPIDEDFIAALRAGMPPSAGIALGVDRLAAVFTGSKNIADWMVLPKSARI